MSVRLIVLSLFFIAIPIASAQADSARDLSLGYSADSQSRVDLLRGSSDRDRNLARGDWFDRNDRIDNRDTRRDFSRDRDRDSRFDRDDTRRDRAEQHRRELAREANIERAWRTGERPNYKDYMRPDRYQRVDRLDAHHHRAYSRTVVRR